MRTFFTWTGLLVAVLLVYSACDSGVDTLDDRIDTPPGDLIEIEAIVDPGFRDAVETLAIQLYEDVYGPEAEQPCIAPPLDVPAIDEMNSRLDKLLGQLGEGINRHNIMEHVATMDSTQWAQMDSVAMRTLYNEYKDLQINAYSSCSAMDDIEDMAKDLFAEYAHIIREMGWSMFVDATTQIVASMEDDYGDSDVGAQLFRCCKCKCGWRAVADGAATIAAGAVVAGGCGYVTGASLGSLGPVCYTALGGTVISMGIDTVLDLSDCREECNKKKEEDSDGESLFLLGAMATTEMCAVNGV